MPFDTSTLNTYVKENKDILLAQSVTDSKTADIIAREGHLLTGVKTSEKVGVVSGDVVLQDGDGCGFSASGDTKISQREVVVKAVKVNEELCPKDLQKFFTQQMMAPGTPEGLPPAVEEKYVEVKMDSIEAKMDRLMWQGDKLLTGNLDLKWIDGFLKILDNTIGAVAVNAKRGAGTITATTGAATVAGVNTLFSSQVAVGDKIYSGGLLIGTVSSIASNTALTLAANGAAAATGAAYTIAPAAVTSPILGSTGITPANVVAVVNSVYAGIPAAVLDNIETKPVYIFMGTDIARMHLMALSAADLFNYKVEGDELQKGYYLPGTNVKVMPLSGLTGTGYIVGMAADNMWEGTDLENEHEDFDMWWSQDDRVVKFVAEWKIGVQIAFPDEVAYWRAAA